MAGNTRSVPGHLGDLRAGSVLADRYRLEEPLGRGATAHVWRARDVDLGRVVAVKLLGDAVEPELRERFNREGTILGRLSHPNLVAVHGTGTDDERPFLVMDYVDGVPFDAVLAEGPLPWDDAASTLADVAAGLGEAHRNGVLHRDVKPANVVCGRDGVPRLVDFGIARSPDITTMTRADLVLGTASYLSPEQAQARDLAPSGDVYALGCVLFEAVAGHPPFEGDGPLTVALKHVNEEPPVLSEVTDAAVPPALDAVVARCLAKSPGDRYPTAAELEDDLRRVVAGEPPLLGAAAAGAADGDADATTVLAASSAAAAPRDGTMVLPAVAVTDHGEIVDPSPLSRQPASTAGAGPLAAAGAAAAGTDLRPWRNVAIVVGAVILIALLATAAFGGGEDGDELPTAPAADVQDPATTEATAPPETEPPPPPPEDDDGDDDAGGGKAKGKKKKDDD